jgi:hypothetical protein
MVYAVAMRKTASFMALAMMLSLGIILLSTDEAASPTGQVTAVTEGFGGGLWLVFGLGILVGLLLVGAYAYVALEERRS